MTKVLISSSRMPFALDEIRKFGQAGHTVYASDTFALAPGSHSGHVTQRFQTASPTHEPQEFLADVWRIIDECGIELYVPAFEEVFYIAKHLEAFRGKVEVFASPFPVLQRLHHKVDFLQLAKELGVVTPRSIVCQSQEELRNATREFERWFARAAYSRGGVQLLTNTGPLAGEATLEDCHPSAQNPWLVQEFLQGLDVCSFSVARQGKIAAHSSYVHPRTLEHAGGILLESTEDPVTLDIARRFVEATGYHGQISFDFMKVGETYYAIECNPRPTVGVTLMSTEMFIDAMFGPVPDEPRVAPAGVRKMMSVALIRDMLLHWKESLRDLDALMSDADDLYASKHDLLPALYQILSYSHVSRYRRWNKPAKPSRRDLMAAYFFDICWNGEVIP